MELLHLAGGNHGFEVFTSTLDLLFHCIQGIVLYGSILMSLISLICCRASQLGSLVSEGREEMSCRVRCRHLD